jgi:parvulin-like peptidyl-prolyl isomerase
MADLDDSPPPVPDMSVRMELLDILLRVELATQEAYQLGFAPGAEEMARAEAKAVESLGGERELSDALAMTGGTMEQFRNQLARSEAMRAWRDAAFLAGARVTDAEARAFYEAHIGEATHGEEARAVQVMFPLSLMQTPQAEASKKRALERAEEVAKLAKNGVDFAELQRVYMDAATSAAVDGGNLGWVGKMGSFPELEELIFSLKPGEVGGPLETAFSIHVVKILETRPAGVTPFAELKPGIVSALAAAKIDMLVRERTSALLDAADVTITDPELAAAWAEYRRTGAVESAPPDPVAGEAGEAGGGSAAGGRAQDAPGAGGTGGTPGTDGTGDAPEGAPAPGTAKPAPSGGSTGAGATPDAGDPAETKGSPGAGADSAASEAFQAKGSPEAGTTQAAPGAGQAGGTSSGWQNP